MKDVTVVNHPLVQHKLTIMRDKETSTAGFRRLLREISLLLGYEVTRDLELTTRTIETPIQTMEAPTLEGKKLVFASVLRAGNGLLEGLLDLVPAARVAHIGLYRDHDTLEAVEYFFKAPSDLGDRLVTTGVGTLSEPDAAAALDAGLAVAEGLRQLGLIEAAALFLNGGVRLCGAIVQDEHVTLPAQPAARTKGGHIGHRFPSESQNIREGTHG